MAYTLPNWRTAVQSGAENGGRPPQAALFQSARVGTRSGGRHVNLAPTITINQPLRTVTHCGAGRYSGGDGGDSDGGSDGDVVMAAMAVTVAVIVIVAYQHKLATYYW